MNRTVFVWMLVLCVSAGAAWSSGDVQKVTDAEKPELSVMGFWEFCPGATSETITFKWWGDAVGAVMKPLHVPRPDFDVKMSTMLASKEFPDIMRLVSATSQDIHMDLGPQGWFVNTSKAIQQGKMPNLKSYVDQFPGDILLFAPDGNSYMQPHLNMWGQKWVFSGFNLRAELLEKAGWDISTAALDKRCSTVDGLLEAIRVTYGELNKQLGEAAPKPIIHNRGVRGLLGGTFPRNVMKPFGTDLRIRYADTNIYEYGPATENFKIALQFSNTLFNEGMVHPAWMTMTEEEQSQLDWREGRSGVVLGSAWGAYEIWALNDPFPNAKDYSAKNPSVNGKRAKWRLSRKQRASYVINARSPNVDKAIEASDWCYGDKGAEILIWGPEDYAWVKDSSTPWLRKWTMSVVGYYPEVSEEEAADHSAKTLEQCMIEGPARTIPSNSWGLNVLASYYHPTETPDLWKGMMKQDSYYAQWEAMGLILEEPEPVFNFTTQELEEKANLEAALNTFVDEELVKFINGQRSFATWDDFQKKIVELGGKRLEQIYNTALDRHRKAAGG